MDWLYNPDVALMLYILVIIAAVMLGPGWKPILSAIVGSSKAAQTKATGK